MVQAWSLARRLPHMSGAKQLRAQVPVSLYWAKRSRVLAETHHG